MKVDNVSIRVFGKAEHVGEGSVQIWPRLQFTESDPLANQWTITHVGDELSFAKRGSIMKLCDELMTFEDPL